MTDLHNRLTCPSHCATATELGLETVFLERWIVPYRIPNTIRIKNGPQFVQDFRSNMNFCEIGYDNRVPEYHRSLLPTKMVLHKKLQRSTTEWLERTRDWYKPARCRPKEDAAQ